MRRQEHLHLLHLQQQQQHGNRVSLRNGDDGAAGSHAGGSERESVEAVRRRGGDIWEQLEAVAAEDLAIQQADKRARAVRSRERELALDREQQGIEEHVQHEIQFWTVRQAPLRSVELLMSGGKRREGTVVRGKAKG